MTEIKYDDVNEDIKNNYTCTCSSCKYCETVSIREVSANIMPTQQKTISICYKNDHACLIVNPTDEACDGHDLLLRFDIATCEDDTEDGDIARSCSHFKEYDILTKDSGERIGLCYLYAPERIFAIIDCMYCTHCKYHSQKGIFSDIIKIGKN